VEWSEPSLIEYEFKFGAKRRTGIARLGFPRLREGDREWSCACQIEGLKDGEIRLVRGADGLQALTIASSFIRKVLDRLKIVGAEVVPHEIVFPRYVPFCLGVEHHRHLCKILDAEVKKKERQLSRRRRARKRRT
jgi:hypothetical protein